MLVSVVVVAIACFVPASCKLVAPTVASSGNDVESGNDLPSELTVNQLADLIHTLVSRDLAIREQVAEIANPQPSSIYEIPSNFALESSAPAKRAAFQFYGARGKKAVFGSADKRFSYMPSRG
uniref:Secreted protein n=1 Tax=Panagrellus redivivus TaxID=6233 RepID=A0A7E4V3T9_PANRE